MKIKDLVGFQLVSIDESAIVVMKDDMKYKIAIKIDDGDCCGYSDLSTKLVITDEEIALNPIITNIEVERCENGDNDKCKITFFGEYKPLAVLDSESGSGSGWCYGACVSVLCDPLNLEDVITEW